MSKDMKKPLKILLIEDDESIRDVLKSLFTMEGVEIIPSLDLTEIEVLTPEVDLVLSDYNMGLDFQAVKKIATDAKKPLLLMSGNPEAESQHTSFVAKPFRFKELVGTVIRLIAAAA